MYSTHLSRLGRVRKAFGDLRRWLADPRVRAIACLVLLLVVFALAWHLVGMAAHFPGMVGGACLALLATGLLVFVITGTSALPIVSFRVPLASPSAPRPMGRDPPPNGDVLRM